MAHLLLRFFIQPLYFRNGFEQFAAEFSLS